MSEQAGMPGELIYEHAVQIKQVTEYGVAFDRLLSRAAGPPGEGARFDLYVEGTVTGPKLKGTCLRSPEASTFQPNSFPFGMAGIRQSSKSTCKNGTSDKGLTGPSKIAVS